MKIYLKLTSWSIWAALDLRLSKMVPKLTMWSIGRPWVQYMYRDWRPNESQTCRGMSVRLRDSLHRAERPWHDHGQRANGPNIEPSARSGVKVIPCRRAKVGPNSLKFQGSQNGAKRKPKFTGLGVAGFGPCAPKLDPNIRIECF